MLGDRLRIRKSLTCWISGLNPTRRHLIEPTFIFQTKTSELEGGEVGGGAGGECTIRIHWLQTIETMLIIAEAKREFNGRNGIAALLKERMLNQTSEEMGSRHDSLGQERRRI